MHPKMHIYKHCSDFVPNCCKRV